MKVRIGRRRSRTDAKHAVRTPMEIALGPAFFEGEWDVPDRFNFTRDVVDVLGRDPKRHALMCLDHDGVIEPRTFRTLSDNATRWGALLQERGVARGDRVVVVLGNTPEWLEMMLACLKIGAVTVPCSESLAADALAVRVHSSGATLVVASRRLEDEIARMDEPPDVVYSDERPGRSSDPLPDVPTEDTSARDVAFILSTVGTSGDPKGVAHTHGATFAARVQAEYWLDAGPGDAVWCTADSGDALAVWTTLVGPWSRGAATILHRGGFDPSDRLDLIDRLGTTILCQTPAEYAALTELREFTRFRPQRLRRLVSTGDILDPDVLAAYEETWGMTIHEGYGLAETGVIVANGIDAGFRQGSVGLPIVGHEVAVIDDQGNVLEPGIEGELALRGRPPSLFSQYFEAPEETRAAFRGDWYTTGDIAATDEDGFVWFAGRAEDMITSRGHRFAPSDVERALRGHNAVVESAAVGIRDLERGGHFVRGYVVLAAGLAPSETLEAELRSFVGSTLPEYQVPREIDFVDSLPKASNGNIRRAELRERPLVGRSLWETGAGSDSAPVVVPEPPVRKPIPEPPALLVPEPPAPPRPEIERVWPADAKPVLPDPVEPPAAELEPAAYVEPAPYVEPVPHVEPEPVPLVESDPVAYVEPEPVLYIEPGPVPIVEPEPEPVAYVEPEPEPTVGAPDPEPIAEVEPEPALVEPEPVAYVAPEQPVVAEPEPMVEVEAPPVEPEPVASVEPEAPIEPEPVAYVEPKQPVVSAPEPGPIEPVLQPEPVAYVEPEEPVVADAEPLPDYIVPPDGTKPPRETDDSIGSSLDFPSTADLKLDRTEDATPRKRLRREPVPSEDRAPDGPRSAGEPGDETEEVDWMQGLSTRLSAYSLSQDESPPPPPATQDTEDEDSDDV